MVRLATAGEHGVGLLAGLFPGQQTVHGVGCDSLGGVGRGRVAEFHRVLHVGDKLLGDDKPLLKNIHNEINQLKISFILLVVSAVIEGFV